MHASSLLALAGLLGLASLPAPCHADSKAFLMPSAGPEQRRRSVVLAELHEALRFGRRTTTETDLARLEELLKPVVLALPSRANGKLGAQAARYALHRVFVQLHGWRMRGMDFFGLGRSGLAQQQLGGGEEEMPDDVRALFEQRLSQGCDLHELAALAAAVEHVVHADSEHRLGLVFTALGHPFAAQLDAAAAVEIIEAYAAVFILGVENITTRTVRKLMTNILEELPGFPETQAFVQDVFSTVIPSDRMTTITFQDVEHVIEEFSNRFGHWQNQGCEELKTSLVGMEDKPNSGRVRLSTFYHVTVNEGKWFDESPPFLEQQGALDNSTSPAVPYVVIPNYIGASSNCLAETRYYSVCCFDVCEELFGRLERHFMAPVADAAAIADVVSTLPAYHGANVSKGALPAALVARLEGIAAEHGGQVPIHGRLFAQWMHHAYPRDCVYPRSIPAAERPLSTQAFEEKYGRTYRASPMEMQQILTDSADVESADDDGAELCSALPWEHHEELLDGIAHTSMPMSWWRRVGRIAKFILPLVTASIAIARLAVPFWMRTAQLRGITNGKPVVHFV